MAKTYGELLREALELKKQKELQNNQDYIGAGEPPIVPPINTNQSPYNQIPSVSGYKSIVPGSAEVPTTTLKILPAPTLEELATQGYKTEPIGATPPIPSVPPTAEVPVMNVPKSPVMTLPTPTKPPVNPFTRIGRGLKAGLNELFTGMKLGKEGYRDLNLYREKLPYEQAKMAQEQEYKKELLQSKPEKQVSAVESIRQRWIEKDPTLTENELTFAGINKPGKPEITLDQRINNLQQYINSIAPLDMRGRRQIPKDPEKLKIFNRATAELNSLIFKGLSGETTTPSSITKESLIQQGFTPEEADEYLSTQR